MMNTIRAFIAIELPPDTLAQLAEVQANLKLRLPRSGLRWVRPEGTHLTLKFLGDVPTTQVAEIKSAMVQAASTIPSFRLEVGQAGCFPNLSRPRVVWVGIHPHGDELKRLHLALESAISPLGYPTENRPFSPHLTLARVERNINANTLRQIGEELRAAEVGTLGQINVDEVALIQSHLKPSGAEYTPLMRARLAG